MNNFEIINEEEYLRNSECFCGEIKVTKEMRQDYMNSQKGIKNFFKKIIRKVKGK